MAHHSSTHTSSGGCQTLPPCPACGGLECLCRPRFYAGQRLTEDDLNRLENYVVAKNKLHNRHLHGFGVVCGLEVACSPCGGGVRVKPGYALSPCGSDIIVCKEDAVDVCALIQACRPATAADCASPWPVFDDDCQEATEDWVLAVCYEERMARSQPTLSGGGCGCGCGGASPCAGQAAAGQTAARRPSPSTPACEPALICEGYRYRVYKAPVQKRDAAADPGAMLARVQACIGELAQWFAALPKAGVLPQQRYQWFCDAKQRLRERLAAERVADCALAEQLAEAHCPAPGADDDHFQAQWLEARRQLLAVYVELIRQCFCAALLPPCPPPAPADCVPLAMLTVRRRDCRVMRICNLEARKFAVTVPNLGYWLSFLAPYAQLFSAVIARACCDPLDLGWGETKAPGVFEGGMFGVASAARVASPAHPASAFSVLLRQAFSHPERGDAAAALLALDMLGAVDGQGNPLLGELESRNPAQFLLLNQVIAPLLAGALPPSASRASAEASASQADEIARLGKMVEALSQQVDELKRAQS